MTAVLGLDRILGRALGISSTTAFDDDRYTGCYDGAAGVQWHLATERATGAAWLAVNLEGLKYGGERPIRKFLHRELARPAVLGVLRLLPRPHEVIVHLARDAWAGPRTRVYTDAWTIARHPASELTQEIWFRMMADGLACLTPEGGRGRQSITRAGASSPEMLEVVPHFSAAVRVWPAPPGSPQEAVALVGAAKAHLQPVHAAVVDRLSY
jgi:hypothetical protein